MSMRIIAGHYRNRTLVTPKGTSTRPTSGKVRAAVFNIIQHHIQDLDFLDLFAGSGAMGLEALSRGARSATFIERDIHAAKVIHANIEALGVKGQATVLGGDALTSLKYLERAGNTFGVIYADPPYEAFELYTQIIEAIEASSLLLPNGDFFIEESVKAPDYAGTLLTLTLKSSRTYGKSQLRHYERLSS